VQWRLVALQRALICFTTVPVQAVCLPLYTKIRRWYLKVPAYAQTLLSFSYTGRDCAVLAKVGYCLGLRMLDLNRNE
jgi:hypothetical protein